MTRHQLAIVTVPIDQLTDLIQSAFAKAMEAERHRQAADNASLSLNGAARLARRRRDTVAAALESGALKGRRYGESTKRPRWAIIAADVRAWVERGAPVSP